MLFGRLVSWNMLVNCLFSRNPERPFDVERPRNWGSFGAELNGLKPWRRGGFRCEELGLVWSRTQWVKAVAEGWFQMLLGGWKAFGRLLVEAFWEAG